MRFKRGSKVEVINKKHSPVSWRCAEILSGDGYTYTVRYDYYRGMESRVRIERVSRKDVRSCTTSAEGMDNQEIGHSVEVFNKSCRKTGTIVKVLNNDYYLVQQTGCLKQLCVHKSNTRVLHFWPSRESIRKRSGCRRPDKLSALEPSKKVSKVLSFSASNKFHVGDDRLAAQECTELQKSHISSSLLLNRASHFPLCKNESSRNIQELEATERASKRRRLVPAALTGEKYVQDSWNNVSDEYCASEQAKNAESSDCRSDATSVGSCSINDEFPNRFSNFSPEEVHCQGTELLHSDTESSLNSASKEERRFLSSPEKIGVSIHNMELHAYRCTLEALYASGPLSWDQEALLTNLRIALRISNDEHLAELRTLISAGTGIHGNSWMRTSFASKSQKMMFAFAAPFLAF